ncbi:DUF2851 family protein [Paludibacteraceae bacterium OttesenSCG-928-F17]|nr:DUF2851 family protein [Paludibacteraceae bacterium OttesenSCG-928-F17]
MKESILHYVWQFKLFSALNLKTTDGEPVEIIDTGRLNHNSGPDFFNAKIKIDNTVWAGNVEIHTKSSDWKRHLHQHDKAYDSVILHVVENPCMEVFRTNGQKIPQLKIEVPDYIQANFHELQDSIKKIHCQDKINQVEDILVKSWKNALLTERLQQKTEGIDSLLTATKGSWEECLYIVLAKNFGFSKNSQPFEILAHSIPLKVLAKHKHNLLQLEAILFGQAGLLPEQPIDEYTNSLKKEYDFLRAKYNLVPRLDNSQWKLSKLRPDNFPHIRIAQFAALLHSSSKLFSKILENPEMEAIQKLFDCKPSEYWQTHYTFSEEESKQKTGRLGIQSIRIILINTVVPFLFYYGFRRDNEELKEKALQILEQIPAEKNSIIHEWEAIGFSCQNAYDTQALIQLRKIYCDEKNCLRCRIGHKVLTIKNQHRE